MRYPIILFRAGCRCVLIGCIIALGCNSVCAQDALDRVQVLKDTAKNYYWGVGKKQDYRRALELYEQAASLGDVEASYIAGGMYYTGKGVSKNLERAFYYLDYAAAQGKSTVASQRALAQFYLLGSVVPQNYAKAAEWYQSAAAAGDAEAQTELGFLYFAGRGVMQDHERSFQLFRQAAYQNSSVAQYNLAIMWYTGNGVAESDLIKAYAWFSVSASNGFANGRQALDYLTTILSETQIGQAQQEASKIFTEIRSHRSGSDAGLR